MLISQYERTNDIATPPLPLPKPAIDRFLTQGLRQQPNTDAVSRLLPPWRNGTEATLGATTSFGAITDLLTQLIGLLSQFLGALPNLGAFGDTERFFQHASGASTGDPHLTFNGAHWDSMTSHSDLLHSDSIPGGYQLSTEVTQPNANGVTLNRQATITTNNGDTTISLDNTGNASITDGDRTITLNPGTTIDLSNGERITRTQDGALQIQSTNDTGGTITTNLKAQNGGVDITIDANNVDLAGDLTTQQAPIPTPFQPLATPTPHPQHQLRHPREPESHYPFTL